MMAIVLGLSLLLKGNKKGSKAFIIAAVIVMFCIMGLRDVSLIGNDSASSYLHAYDRIQGDSFKDFALVKDGELVYNNGFYFLMKLASVSGLDYQAFVILLSAFIMLSVGHLVKRYSVSPVQSFCYFWGLLLYIMMFDALKQATAMAVLIFAFDAVIDKKPLKFVLLVFLATTFHFPALVFIMAYPISKIKVGRSFVILLAAILLLTFIFRDQLITMMMKAYKDTDEAISLVGVRFLSNKALIMTIIVVAALVLRPPTKDDRVYGVLIEFTSFAIVFQTFCGYNNIFERLADYYFQFAIILIPMVFEKTKLDKHVLSEVTENMVKSVAPYMFSGFGVWRFAEYISNQGGIFLPFVFCFQNK